MKSILGLIINHSSAILFGVSEAMALFPNKYNGMIQGIIKVIVDTIIKMQKTE